MERMQGRLNRLVDNCRWSEWTRYPADIHVRIYLVIVFICFIICELTLQPPVMEPTKQSVFCTTFCPLENLQHTTASISAEIWGSACLWFEPPVFLYKQSRKRKNGNGNIMSAGDHWQKIMDRCLNGFLFLLLVSL